MRVELYSPAGRTETSQVHARRLNSLAGKRIGLLSNASWQAFRSLPLLKQHLEQDFPSIEVLPSDSFPEGTDFIQLDSTIEIVKKSGVDAVIVGNAACGGCSTNCAIAAGKLELAGIPTVTVTREDFVHVVRNAVSGLGLPDLSMVTFPIDLFLPDSDLTSLSTRRREIYDRLTAWSPELRNDTESPMITIEGADYQDVFTKANDLFMLNRWGDGLPLWPPSRERVEWILRGTDLPRDHRLGNFPPRGGIATVEACAVALAMAGGRPEYLAVLIAAVDGMLDPEAITGFMQATSAATFPVVIVNGPIAREIRLNSGFGCLGPDPKFPAGTSIGRALRQLQQNLGGADPGTGTMAPWGALRTTNIVFAEDEEGLPRGWLPHGSERHGFAPGTNSISFFWANGAANILRRGAMKERLEQDVLEGLHRTAEYMAVPNYHYLYGYDEGTPGAVLLTRTVADYLASTGWTKEKIRQFLWEKSRVPQEVLRRSGGHSWIQQAPTQMGRDSVDLDPWPIASKPENIILVVAGGGHPTHAYWMQGFSPVVIGRTIKAPQGLATLLAAADRDLGCAAEACIL